MMYYARYDPLSEHFTDGIDGESLFRSIFSENSDPALIAICSEYEYLNKKESAIIPFGIPDERKVKEGLWQATVALLHDLKFEQTDLRNIRIFYGVREMGFDFKIVCVAYRLKIESLPGTDGKQN